MLVPSPRHSTVRLSTSGLRDWRGGGGGGGGGLSVSGPIRKEGRGGAVGFWPDTKGGGGGGGGGRRVSRMCWRGVLRS